MLTLWLTVSQGQLFSVENMVPKKSRPMSAALLREHDKVRARPRSAVTPTTANFGQLTDLFAYPVLLIFISINSPKLFHNVETLP